MKLKYSQIHELFQYRNKVVFCQIKIKPRNILYFYGQQQQPWRWMLPENWAKFDEGLHRILKKNINDGNSASLEREWKEEFSLGSSISVHVKKAGVPLETLCDCMLTDIKKTDIIIALECTVEYNDQNNINDKSSNEIELEEYEPEFIKSENLLLKANTDTPYVPYTPSKKEAQSLKSNYRENVGQMTTIAIEPYLPKPIHGTSVDGTTDSIVVPSYNPGRIRSPSIKNPKHSLKEEKSTKKQKLIKLAQRTGLKSADDKLSKRKISEKQTNHTVAKIPGTQMKKPKITMVSPASKNRLHSDLFGSDNDETS